MHVQAARRPYLTEEAAENRFEWAMQHRDFPLAFWRRVLFTDKSTMQGSGGPNVSWVFRSYCQFFHFIFSSSTIRFSFQKLTTFTH